MKGLTHNEINDLYDRYLEITNIISKRNKEKPLGQGIKQIQIPSSLTESFVYHFISEKPTIIGINDFNQSLLIKGNMRTYDLIYNDIINIEVKAAETNVFQIFRSKALKANYVF